MSIIPPKGLDTTFGTNGIVTTNLGQTIVDGNFINSLAIQNFPSPKGTKIIAVGQNGSLISVVRYNSNGTIDTTFGLDSNSLNNNGIITFPGSGNTESGRVVKILEDNSIVILSWSANSGFAGFRIIKLTADGQLDTSFNNGNVIYDVTSFQGSPSTIISKTINNINYLLIGGIISLGGVSQVLIARYKMDGTLDTTFGNYDKSLHHYYKFNTIKDSGDIWPDLHSNGTSLYNYGYRGDGFYGYSGQIVRASLSTDDKKYGSSSIYFNNTQSYGNIGCQYLNFTVDDYPSGFNNGFTTTFWINATQVNRDQYIFDFANGEAANRNNMILYVKTDGTLVYYPNISLTAIPVQQSASNVFTFGQWNHIAITISAGASSRTFKLYVNGTEILTNTLNIGAPMGSLSAQSCKLGATVYNSNGELGLVGYIDEFKMYARPLSSSDILNTYNNTYNFLTGSSLIKINANSNNSMNSKVVELNNGLIMIGCPFRNLGSSNHNIALFRTTSAGIFDPTFGTSGNNYAIVDFGSNNYDEIADLNKQLIDDVEKLIVCGNNGTNGCLCRINLDGTVDTTFGVNGYVTTPLSKANTVLIQSNQKIIVGGVRSNHFTVVRYNKDGTLDTNFDDNSLGYTTTTIGSQSILKSLAYQTIDSYDRLVVGGSTYNSTINSNTYALARYNGDYTMQVPNITQPSNIIKTYGDSVFTLSNPVSNSNGSWTFTSSNSSKVSISGNQVTILEATDANGVTITARQAEDPNLFKSGSTTFKIIINKIIPVVGAFSIPNKSLSDISYTIVNPTKPLDHTGNWVYTSSDTTKATVSGNVITFVSAGIVKIIATLTSTTNYKTYVIESPFSISASGTPASTFNFTEYVYVENLITNNTGVTITNNIVNIINSFATPDVINKLNPSGGTPEEKEINRATMVQYLFNVYANQELNINSIEVPKSLIYLSPQIDQNMVDNINLFNAILTTDLSPLIINLINYNPNNAIYTVTDQNLNTVIFNGYGSQYNNKSLIIKRLTNNNYTIIRTSSGNILSTESGVKGDIIYDLDFKFILGTVEAQRSQVDVTGSFTISNKTYLTDTTFTNPTIVDTNVIGGFNWSSSDSSIVSYDNNVATILRAGTVTLTATPINTSTYIGTISNTLVIDKANPTITQPTNITKTYGDSVFTLSNPVSNSNGSWTFSSADSTKVSILGNQVTILQATDASGVTITATQAEVSNFFNSGSTTFKIIVNSQNLTITQPANITKILGSIPFNLSNPTSNSSGSWTFSSADSTKVSISGNQVTMTEASDVNGITITATQASVPNQYNSGSSTFKIIVNRATRENPLLVANDYELNYALTLGKTQFIEVTNNITNSSNLFNNAVSQSNSNVYIRSHNNYVKISK